MVATSTFKTATLLEIGAVHGVFRITDWRQSTALNITRLTSSDEESHNEVVISQIVNVGNTC